MEGVKESTQTFNLNTADTKQKVDVKCKLYINVM